MEAVAIVIALALAQYLFFGAKVGQARAKYGVKAPAINGNAEFERIFRIHQNTLEQLVVVVPALLLFANYVHAPGAAVLGVIYLVGRIMYFYGYRESPDKRAVGFLTGYLATAVLVLGGLGGIIWSMLK